MSERPSAMRVSIRVIILACLLALPLQAKDAQPNILWIVA